MEPQIIEKLWSVDPTSVFGVLVLLLALANYLQWRRICFLQNKIIEQNDDFNAGLKAIVNKFLPTDEKG